ncbi:hypothetical protein [Micromonospora sp. NPDC051296]|uniref:hypothetical protein n=1 Tax=Micromonospora sp. NPDC051296 TaxID=3155046 RepID=UPI0034465CFC
MAMFRVSPILGTMPQAVLVESPAADEETTPRKPGSLTISWRMIAFSCALLAAGSTGTLAIVVPVKDVDTLSTIALALAILAFVIQIIVFIAQSWTSGQQMLQSQAINSDTRSPDRAA